MNISIWILFGILFFHWLFDFCFQTDWQATNKSKSNKALLSHTGIYSLCWFIVAASYGTWKVNDFLGLEFMTITFICHTITDYFTSRLNSKLWKEQKVHYFFVSVGFDQLLHYIQLVLTFYFLTN